MSTRALFISRSEEGFLAVARPWLMLAKPGVTRLVVITTWLGALAAPGSLSGAQWLATLLGTALVVAAANAFNMVAERDTDALMERTRQRPLPTGRIEPRSATRVAWAWAVTGTAALVWVHWLCALLALLALASYVWAYTPLKRVTPHALYVGTLPGAIPPLIGYAAVSNGQLAAPAWLLFSILLVWQIPHFLAISVFRRDEYARAKIQVFSVCRSERHVRWLTVGWSLVLFATSLLPVLLGEASTLYLAIAIGFGAPFVAGAFYGLSKQADERWARSLFFASMPHLVVLFVGLLL